MSPVMTYLRALAVADYLAAVRAVHPIFVWHSHPIELVRSWRFYGWPRPRLWRF